MKPEGFDVAFSQQYLHAALWVSLLSVWVLVGLFFYLNRYTKREYFTVWTAAWLFYALWLTLSLNVRGALPGTLVFMLKQWCVSISAVFLLWGSLRFLNVAVRQTLFGLFMLFLIVWSFVSPQVLVSVVAIQLPVFILLGSGSVFAASCFYRLRKRMPYVGAGMLALGFLLWGVYLATYPISQAYSNLYSVGFFVAAVLQLYIAVSMIVLVLEEVRYATEHMRSEIETVRSEKDALHIRVLTTEEECRSLYDQVRLSEGVQEAYEELRRTQQAVVQQERLRALGQMSSGVAHDINNALSPIVAYSDLLLTMHPELPEATRRHLETINRAGEDIARIVARMREFYRRRTDTEMLMKLDMNRIIEEVVELTRPRWRDLAQRDGISIEIRRDLKADLPPLVGEPTELREALINLVFNSVDALPRGGTITLSTRCVHRSASDNSGGVERHVQVEVRDDGIGMDEKVRQRCLEPFFSTKTKCGGTGLGLAMVYGMMQRQDGTIEIDSTLGQGTCVRLTFPIKAEPRAADRQPVAAAGPSRPISVLCIDDEQNVRQLLQDCLGHFKHRVGLASNGKQGLEMLRESHRTNQPYQVVITDLGMPDLDGHQVAHTVKAEFPGTPVVMMTGWGAMMKEDGQVSPEVDALLSKPPQMRKLNDLLVQLTAANAQHS